MQSDISDMLQYLHTTSMLLKLIFFLNLQRKNFESVFFSSRATLPMLPKFSANIPSILTNFFSVTFQRTGSNQSRCSPWNGHTYRDADGVRPGEGEYICLSVFLFYKLWNLILLSFKCTRSIVGEWPKIIIMSSAASQSGFCGRFYKIFCPYLG